ncbi:MAG: aldo/keto reductase [Azoarcus sp.]|nr:aldo/keto reductase [Azoarcus sp.]
MLSYLPASGRYDAMPYRRCGRRGLKLPAVSLGLWHNFGHADRFDNARELIRHAFDLGITHFDLANNYGPPPGSAESVFGEILRQDLAGYRDELIISTKAGFPMGPGPYGVGGSRKYLISSLDQSLRRLGLDYVDIFYHHCPDPDTPLDETLAALEHIVHSGRALYVGLSNYPPALFREAAAALRALGTPCLLHQPRYNMFDREIETGLLDALAHEGVGCIAFSPLAQGLLSDKYLGGTIPTDSRAARGYFLTPADVTPVRLARIEQLNAVASTRGQSLAQMALAWVLRHPGMSSVLIGASRTSQIDDAIGALQRLEFTAEELAGIDHVLQAPPTE